MLKKITLTLMCRMVSDTTVPEPEGAVRKLFQSRQEKMVVYTSGSSGGSGGVDEKWLYSRNTVKAELIESAEILHVEGERKGS